MGSVVMEVMADTLLLLPNLLLLLLPHPTLSDGLPFDIELYPPSLHRAHELLSEDELLHMFGVTDPNQVEKDSYHLTTMTNVLEEAHAMAKRSGEQPPDAAYKLSAFGNSYNLKLMKRSSLVKPGAKVVLRDKAENGTHIYTEWVANGNFPVAWLEAEDELFEYEDYEGEDIDNTKFSTCDHYINRSFDNQTTVVITDCYSPVESEVLCEEHRNCTFEHIDYGGYDELTGYEDLSLGSEFGRKQKGRVQDLTGVVLGNNGTYEIYSVPTKIKEMITAWRKDTNQSIEETGSNDVHILVKKATFPAGDFSSHIRPTHQSGVQGHSVHKRDSDHKDKRRPRSQTMYIETALFMDHKAYQTYKRYFSKTGHTNPDKRIVDLLLTFMNTIQAIYHFDSLGTKVDFSITRLEIHKSAGQFEDYGGDRGPMLSSFCLYQGGLRPDEGAPGHWDIGLLVSGVDFWAKDSKGKTSSLTMGLATVTGICTQSYGCVIGEMGVRNRNGKPYPSTGFTSVYVMAHEIGHNLGMSHDHKEGCDRNGFIMSESRGTKGESRWSQCSVNSLSRYISDGSLSCLEDDNAKKAESLGLENEVYPGEVWSANSQCQIFLLDSDAH